MLLGAAMLATIRKLLEMIRFSHTVFALPFALLAAVMAWRLNSLELAPVNEINTRGFYPITNLAPGPPPLVRFAPIPAWTWQQLLGILLCMVFARSAAMAFNRIADRRIDGANPRTAGRHLPSGTLTLRMVAVFAILMSLGFIASTTLFLFGPPLWSSAGDLTDNTLPLYLSLPVLAFLMGYSYAKRFTALAHFWLGAALMMAPLAAWIAIRGQIVLAHPADILPALVLGGAVLFWVAGFDIIYACQDAEFDRGQRLRSVPARLGVPAALRLAAACHAATVAMLALLPLVFPYFGWIYWLGVAVIAGLLIYEHWIVRPDNLTRVNVAFFHVNAVISLGLLLVATADLMWHSAIK